jgi:hypothetical protein
MSETSMAGLLGGADGEQGAPPPMWETLMVGPIVSADSDLGRPTIDAKSINGGPPGPHRGPVSIRVSKGVL